MAVSQSDSGKILTMHLTWVPWCVAMVIAKGAGGNKGVYLRVAVRLLIGCLDMVPSHTEFVSPVNEGHT